MGLLFLGSDGSEFSLGLTGFTGAGVLGIMFENNPNTDDMDGPPDDPPDDPPDGFDSLDVCVCSW